MTQTGVECNYGGFSSLGSLAQWTGSRRSLPQHGVEQGATRFLTGLRVKPGVTGGATIGLSILSPHINAIVSR